jgi:hypothetical protein
VRMQSTFPFIVGALAIGALGGGTAAAQPAEPVKVENLTTLSATVESIDLDKRLVELRSEDRTTTVEVPAEVRNLAQLKVGDEVVVQYYEALAAQFKKKGTSQTIGVVDVTTGAGRALPGAKPGAGLANKVTSTVVIEAVDRPANSVTFVGPSGMTRTVNVKDPRAQQFIGTLKKGDEVELTYIEALAINVQPKR